MRTEIKSLRRGASALGCIHLLLAALMIAALLLLAGCGGDEESGGGGNPPPPPPPNGGNTCTNNDSPQCATRLVGNSPSISERANSANDRSDYLRYAPTQSGEVTVRLYNYGANDLDLDIRSAANRVLAESDSATDPEERVVLRVAAGQVYFIRVYAYETGGTTTGYSLAVSLRGVSAPPPSSAMNFAITDSCNDGRAIRFKFFDKDNDLVWPSASSHYTTPGYGERSNRSLGCVAGAKICYGASLQADGSGVYWGAGLFGDKGCTDCCYRCTHGASLARNLVCD